MNIRKLSKRKIQLKGERLLRMLNQPHVLSAIAFVAVMAVQSSGFCADEASTGELNQLTENVVETMFGSWVRKTALAFGGGAGLFQSYMSGSIKPLLTWGGLGLAVNFIPKVITLITSVT